MQMWTQEAVNVWRAHYDEAATYWGKWADQLAEQQDKVNMALLTASGVVRGSKVLDLAAGAGEPAVTASKLVGSEGQVTATDVSEPMLATLAERVARLGLTNVLCQQVDMEALPFDDRSFDAVTCRYGLMYVRDPARAVAEAVRAVRPGGRVGYMVWGPEQNNSVIFLGTRAANVFLGSPIDEPEFQVPTRFAEPGAIADLLVKAGATDVREQELIFEPKIKVGIPFWAPLLEMNATHIWNGLAPDDKKKVHQAIAQAYEPLRNGDHYVLKSHMRIVAGSKA